MTNAMPKSGSVLGIPRKPCLSEDVSQASGVQLHEIKQAMTADAAASPLSREQIAERLSVTLPQINDWCAPTKPHRIPPELIDNWCRVLGSERLRRLLLRGSQLEKLLEIGEAAWEVEQAEMRFRKAKERCA